MRNSMLFMSLFFIIGLIILSQTKLDDDMQKMANEDENDNPWDDILEDLH